MAAGDDPPDLDRLFARALASGGDAAPLESALVERSGLPGDRLDLGLLAAFARTVGEVVARPDPPVARLEALLDGWAALSPDEAPDDQPTVVLPCAAHAAYGEVGARRPDWRADEVAKLRRGAADPRSRVREVAAQALQRLLEVDVERTALRDES